MTDTYEILTKSAHDLEVHKVIGWGMRTVRPSKKLTKRIEALHSIEFDALVIWCLQNVKAIKRSSPESRPDLDSFRARGSSPWRVRHEGADTFPFARGLVLTSCERHDDPMDRIEEQTFVGPRNRWSLISARVNPPPLSVVALGTFLDVAPQELRPVIVVWWAPPKK